MVRLADALGNTTRITYDLLGRKTGMRDPDMGVWGYQYDGNNNLTRQTDARGPQIQFLLDALNRPTETRDVNAGWTLEKRYYDEAVYGQSKGRRTRAEAYSLPRRRPGCRPAGRCASPRPTTSSAGREL